jgi:uncharacterized membrane protein
MPEIKKPKTNLFSKISTNEEAADMAKEVAKGFFMLAALQGAAGLLILKQTVILIDVAMFLIGGFFLFKFKSRIAAVCLFLISLIIIFTTFTNRLGGDVGGGTNIFLALITFWMALRGIEATFKLHKKLSVPDTPDTSSIKES